MLILVAPCAHQPNILFHGVVMWRMEARQGGETPTKGLIPLEPPSVSIRKPLYCYYTEQHGYDLPLVLFTTSKEGIFLFPRHNMILLYSLLSRWVSLFPHFEHSADSTAYL